MTHILHITETFATGVYVYLKDLTNYFENNGSFKTTIIYSGKRIETEKNRFHKVKWILYPNIDVLFFKFLKNRLIGQFLKTHIVKGKPKNICVFFNNLACRLTCTMARIGFNTNQGWITSRLFFL